MKRSTFAKGILTELIFEAQGTERWLVESEIGVRKGVYFTDFGVELTAGDHVFLNTTANELSLGTGGVDYILPADVIYSCLERDDGHIMKLRYTPLQLRFKTIEEVLPLFADSAPGLRVVSIPLISHLPGVIAGIKSVNENIKIAYIMTDEGALPIVFSNVVRELKKLGLIEFTMTVGQAFGGDHEAVNIYSGMAAAKELGAEIVIVGQGPGNVGTGTTLGFGGIGQANVLNAAAALRCVAILSPRISSADERERHRGVSHHTKTITNMALGDFYIPLPEGYDIDPLNFTKGKISFHDVSQALDFALKNELSLYSMGRYYTDDPIFFDAGFASGIFAARSLSDICDKTSK